MCHLSRTFGDVPYTELHKQHFFWDVYRVFINEVVLPEMSTSWSREVRELIHLSRTNAKYQKLVFRMTQNSSAQVYMHEMWYSCMEIVSQPADMTPTLNM